MVFQEAEDAGTMKKIGLNVAGLLIVTFLLIVAATLLG